MGLAALERSFRDVDDNDDNDSDDADYGCNKNEDVDHGGRGRVTEKLKGNRLITEPYLKFTAKYMSFCPKVNIFISVIKPSTNPRRLRMPLFAYNNLCTVGMRSH